jgi:23S rRNA (adenine1618-N6)-methyltransferase
MWEWVPIAFIHEYGWSFIGSDVDETAIASANKIVNANNLQDQIQLVQQENSGDFFYGAIKKEEFVDITLCNPPFHASAKEANEGSLRKLSNLNKKKETKVSLNFGGQSNELWCRGGEMHFITQMIYESRKFGASVFWFTSLVSKENHVKDLQQTLKKLNAVEVKVIPMGQGNKQSRILAWTFLPKDAQKVWKKERWA